MERGTIVVVDDEPNIADLVDLYLTRECFSVRHRPPRCAPARRARRTHHQGIRAVAVPRRATGARAVAPADPRRRLGLRLVRRRADRRRAHRAGTQEARGCGRHHDRARRRVPPRVVEVLRLDVSRPRRRLRTRLTIAMLAIALGVLVVTAGITASL